MSVMVVDFSDKGKFDFGIEIKLKGDIAAPESRAVFLQNSLRELLLSGDFSCAITNNLKLIINNYFNENLLRHHFQNNLVKNQGPFPRVPAAHDREKFSHILDQ